jgi:hypothetical protein
VLKLKAEAAMEALRADPWAFGPYCWLIDEVFQLPAPVPCKGLLNLWETTAEQRAAFASAGFTEAKVPKQALSVRQPWASAIIHGPKRVENRTWARKLPPGGLWLAVHAASALDGTQEDVRGWLAVVLGRPNRRPPPHPQLARLHGLWPSAPPLAALPLGAIIGAVHVHRILEYPTWRE